MNKIWLVVADGYTILKTRFICYFLYETYKLFGNLESKKLKIVREISFKFFLHIKKKGFIPIFGKNRHIFY